MLHAFLMPLLIFQINTKLRPSATLSLKSINIYCCQRLVLYLNNIFTNGEHCLLDVDIQTYKQKGQIGENIQNIACERTLGQINLYPRMI